MSHGPVPDTRRIVLVGFMAAGKTTVGRLLARRLGWDFVDFDDAIRQHTGRSAAELIRQEGEERLRQEEARLTDELAGCRNVVLAPGGGWITRPGLAARLGPGSVVVWLALPAEEAVRRAESEQDNVDRPLLGPPEGRVERATALLRRREPLYTTADVVVDVARREPDQVVEEIRARLRLKQEGNER